MKIIVASFQCESNSKAKLHPKKHDFEYFKGEGIFKKLAVKQTFEEKWQNPENHIAGSKVTTNSSWIEKKFIFGNK